MTLGTGVRIGPHEITGVLGAGAMGEVYRANDTRLGREVALKVLPAEYSADPERLRRFDQEARTAGTLNHPNILTLFDVGTHDGMPYVVSELLEGETLRDRLRSGPLPLRKAIDFGIQAAQGLAAAHARNVIHRDLKPENLFVLRDGKVKILDFGLAKLVRRDVPAGSADSLAGTMTESGLILGTVGYMAPEQARGLPAVFGSDIFSLGCVLFEMLTGQRAFLRDSPVETLAAILNDDPPAAPASLRQSAPGVIALVLRCLEKDPAARFESARDLAFALQALSAGDQAGATRAPAAETEPELTFKRLTFRRGSIVRARFTPDGHSVVYGGAWEGQPVEVFWMHLGNTEGRSIGHPGTDILSVSSSGEMAVSLKRRYRAGFTTTGTLARMPLSGGAARQLLQNVDEADWSPDGSQLAVVRDVEGRNRLEYPIGRTRFETQGYLTHVRISRDGQRVAFIHHDYMGSDSGSVMVLDADGQVRELSKGWGTIRGAAWSADGTEVLFTAHEEGASRYLQAVSLDGRRRVLHQVPGHLCVQDVLPDGRMLITHSTERQAVMVQAPGEAHERDLSWLDWSLLRDMSADGQWLLILESGEGGGAGGAICIRPTDGSPAIRLGEGNPMGFSHDGQWVMSVGNAANRPGSLMLLPTGVGEPRQLDTREIAWKTARFHPDGRSIVGVGSDAGADDRLYRIDIETQSVTRIGPSTRVMPTFELSPDGRFIAAKATEGVWTLYPFGDGEPRVIPGIRVEDEIQPWTAEGDALLALAPGDLPARLYRIDIETGARTLWREVTPPDSSGVSAMRGFRFSPDGRAYGYYYTFQLDDLYLVEGLK